MNVKLYKTIFLLSGLFISSCDEESNTISNPPQINPMYQFNLAFSEDTDNSDTITLSWAESSEISIFNIEIDGEDVFILEEGEYTFLLPPGSFKDVTITADDVLSETIKIFSSPMAPSTWEPNNVGDMKVTESPGGVANQFNWIPSTETDIITIQLQKCGYLNSPNECSELSSFSSVEAFDPGNYTYFETKNSEEKTCYKMNSTDFIGNSRYSQNFCNDLTENAMLDVTITSISNNLDSKISLEWREYNESDFYQYTLYRSENEEIDNDSRIVLAEIIDKNQTVFEDRNNIGKGKTWYYQIEVHNKFGRTSESNIKSGKSKP